MGADHAVCPVGGQAGVASARVPDQESSGETDHEIRTKDLPAAVNLRQRWWMENNLLSEEKVGRICGWGGRGSEF